MKIMLDKVGHSIRSISIWIYIVPCFSEAKKITRQASIILNVGIVFNIWMKIIFSQWLMDITNLYWLKCNQAHIWQKYRFPSIHPFSSAYLIQESWTLSIGREAGYTLDRSTISSLINTETDNSSCSHSDLWHEGEYKVFSAAFSWKWNEIKLYIHPVLLLYEPIRLSCNLMSLICQKMDHKKPNLPSTLVYSLSSTRSIATGDIATLQKMWENNSWARLKASRSLLSLMFLDFQSWNEA